MPAPGPARLELLFEPIELPCVEELGMRASCEFVLAGDSFVVVDGTVTELSDTVAVPVAVSPVGAVDWFVPELGAVRIPVPVRETIEGFDVTPAANGNVFGAMLGMPEPGVARPTVFAEPIEELCEESTGRRPNPLGAEAIPDVVLVVLVVAVGFMLGIPEPEVPSPAGEPIKVPCEVSKVLLAANVFAELARNVEAGVDPNCPARPLPKTRELPKGVPNGRLAGAN